MIGKSRPGDCPIGVRDRLLKSRQRTVDSIFSEPAGEEKKVVTLEMRRYLTGSIGKRM